VILANSNPATIMTDPELADRTYVEPLDADVLVCSDHAAATKATIEVVDRFPGCRGIDAGTLSAAAAIEAFTAVLIGVNIRHRAHASIRLTGLRSEDV